MNSEYYTRAMPAEYTGPTGDLNMQSLINDYALEGRLADGTGGNGQFYLTRAATTEAAKRVIEEHYKWTGEKRDNYATSQMEKLWSHFDVNNDGFIDAS